MASKKEINKVWEKGNPIRGKDPSKYRKDDLGNTIFKPSYGKDTEMGWNIDHKNPKSKGGSDTLRNKRPLQTSENKKKGKKYPYKP